MPNTLFYGDNLAILREHVASESVDLIYLDPPFNSNRSYNVLFKDEHGSESQAQIEAFDDTWHWNDATEAVYTELVTDVNGDVGAMIGALRGVIGTNQMMAYLVMMAVRLVELHRVLKPTGSLYLHCDPTASHYLKIVLDTIFGGENFRSEVSWRRSSAHNDAKQGRAIYGNIRDVIFFYTKSNSWTWNWQFTEYDSDYIESFYSHVDRDTGRRFRLSDLTAAKGGGDTSYEFYGTRPYKGRYWAYSRENMEKFRIEGRLHFPKSGGPPSYKRYLDEMPGVPLQNDWGDIRPTLNNESLGYPTQKPLALLERIIAASSNEGDVVLDPFCGCGTAIIAAEKLKRQWIGIDITHLAIALNKYRLEDAFKGAAQFRVIGEPTDLAGAAQLKEDDAYQFQWWALSLVRARPLGASAGSKTGKKGADQGVDGLIPFLDDGSGKPKRAIVQVKGGHVGASVVRDLVGTLDREKAQMGVLITLEEPTRDMKREAASAGVYRSPGWGTEHPRVQLLTVEQLLAGARVNMPPASGTFKQAPRIKPEGDAEQPALPFGDSD